MKFAMYLTLLFIGLKLGNVIDWSWFWVLSPMPISFFTGVFVIVLSIVFLKHKNPNKDTFEVVKNALRDLH